MAETLKETLEETNAELETLLQQNQVFQDVKKPHLLFGASMNKSQPKW
ncbi:Undefined function [Listeria monocytogenes N53-1]|nr:Undefined function [Listeria monocytogenes]CCQ23195.1 Undefined function [Listeria monocytogenes N53-1]